MTSVVPLVSPRAIGGELLKNAMIFHRIRKGFVLLETNSSRLNLDPYPVTFFNCWIPGMGIEMWWLDVFVAETVPRGNQVSGSLSVGPSLDVTSPGCPERRLH